MENKKELKRYNIEPIRQLAPEELEFIAIETTKKMETMIPEFNGENMYKKIKNAKIYLAKIPNQYSKVNYIVTTNAIYIRGEENIKNIDEILFHEIFHYIQCNSENNYEGMPNQMGLCKFKTYTIKGLAINEASIQLIISIVFNHKQKYSNYFGIEVKSIENKYFPILCSLLQQIAYVVGYLPILKSMLENSDDFKESFEKFAGKKAYEFLTESFDKMMEARDKIIELNKKINNKELSNSKKKIIEKQIKIYVKEIQNHFIALQKLCYKEYFDPLIRKVKTKDDLTKLKEEINRFHEHTGKIGEKDEFMIYVQRKTRKLNKKVK